MSYFAEIYLELPPTYSPEMQDIDERKRLLFEFLSYG